MIKKILKNYFKNLISKKIKELESLKRESNLKMSMQEKANIFTENSKIDFAIKTLKEL